MNTSRHSLIFGLSYALDIAGKNNLSHSKNTAYLAVLIGKEIGFKDDDIVELYYASLLHDIASCNFYKLESHCIDGNAMIRKLPLSENIAKIILYHHEFFDGSGVFGLSGEDIPISSLIICFASAFDDTFGKIEGDYDRDLFTRVNNWLNSNKSLFSEELTDAFSTLIAREHFLLDYFNSETKYMLSSKLIVDDNVYYNYDDVVKYGLCFADIIDCKSPFTLVHSLGIADIARKVVAHMGYDSETQNEMYIAGLLHDIGKLHVSNDILHKNGKLTPEERFEINKHTYYTRKILEQIDGFQDIANYAANHHEKLDGTGYPYQIIGDQLSELERIMAICDVYQALTEERPYREKLASDKVWEIIGDMAENQHLDKVLVQKLKEII